MSYQGATWVKFPQSVLPVRGGNVSLGICSGSQYSQDMSQGSEFSPKGNIEPKTAYIASWRFPTELGEILVSLVQDSVLLFQVHLHGILMRVAVEASAKDFVQPPQSSAKLV